MLVNNYGDENDENSSLLFSSLLVLKLGASLSPAHADPIDDFLTHVGERFDAAKTSAARYALISQPVNLEYLHSLRDGDVVSKKRLKADVSRDPIDNGKGKINLDKTCPLALAVARGRSHLVNKWVSVVGNVNSQELTAWGYRQPYSLAHMTLDPQYPRTHQDIPLADRLAIVDAAGEREADFNSTGHHALMGVYNNPPLAAGEPEGGPLDIMRNLRARALLYGADPSQKGSSFNGVRLDREPQLVDLALTYFVERIRAGGRVRPAPAVLTALRGAALARGVNLDELSQKAASLNVHCEKLEAQIQKNEARLAKVKAQKTKKAKAKATQLQTVIESLRSNIKDLKRKLKKL